MKGGVHAVLDRSARLHIHADMLEIAVVEKVSDQNRRVSRISGTRPESAPEPPRRQVYESAGARRPKAERPLDPLQSAADTAPADVCVHERCEGGRLDGKDRTPVNGNAPEALVAASFFDEFLQQNGELARDDPLACEALAGSFLERRHQEASCG